AADVVGPGRGPGARALRRARPGAPPRGGRPRLRGRRLSRAGAVRRCARLGGGDVGARPDEHGGFTMETLHLALVVSRAGAAPSCSHPQHDMTHGVASGTTRPVSYDTLGTCSYRVPASPEAQRWFDQGLRLVYGFNHLEAQRAFREGARVD